MKYSANALINAHFEENYGYIMAMIKRTHHCPSDLHVSSIYPTPQSYDKLLTQIKETVPFFAFFPE